MIRLKTLFFGATMALLSACASTNVDPIEVGARPDKTTDEAGLWQQMDEYEKDLRASALLERDPALNAYVRSVVCDIAGEEYCNDMRIYVVKRPYFNATMAPNGLMEVWTGLLLRAENEAQVAFVLGHEFTHYKNRHSLKNWRAQRNASNAGLLLTIGAAAAGAGAASDLGGLVALSALYGYGRDLEREADEEGFDYVTAAGYEGREAAALWQSLMDEIATSDSRRKKRRVARASIFSSHPLTKERIATLQDKANQMPGGVTNEARYVEMTGRFLDEWLDADLVRRDYGENLFLVNKLIARGDRLGTLYFRRAEAYRQRRGEGDDVKAIEDYTKAATYEDAPAKTWRYIGDSYRRKGNVDGALSAYQTYLEKAPNSPDRAVVQLFIDQNS